MLCADTSGAGCVRPALALNNPLRKQLKRQLSTRTQFPDGHTVALAYAKVMGARKSLTPSGEPIQIGTVPFDLSATTPAQAIAGAARLRHGIEIHEPHWRVITEYNVTAQAIERHRLNYSKVFVMEYIAERQRRKDLLISDDVLDSFTNSWYLKKVEKVAA
jgi:hypothetical protein